MADDAAGAVRRTRRPIRVPALWWSPTECTVYADREGAAPHYIQIRDTKKHSPLPSDAVQLVGPDQRRPIVLLRAEDCACTYGDDDCPHGPEPVDALDLAVWLHAEAKWQLDEMRLDVEKYRDYLKMANRTTERRGHERDAARAERDRLKFLNGEAEGTIKRALAELRERTAERDGLQARIDAALALIDYWDACGGSIPQGHRLRAALQGDQPTEQQCIYVVVPGEGGRCITPAVHDGLCAEHLAVVATEKAQHVYEDDAAHNWAGICRVCSYPPGGPQHLVAPAEPTGEAHRG